ncbi:MAG TPA: hypothetical protein VL132_10775, partial [Planctomycetaceae bacterium]|nr:hypothetical protein [Planctomycetaceae bacterium]
TLAGRHDILGTELAGAIQQVAQYRQVRLRSLNQVLDGYARIAQQRWSAWRRKQHMEGQIPATFAEVLDRLVAFADLALSGAAANQTWLSADRQWSTNARYAPTATGSILWLRDRDSEPARFILNGLPRA